MNLRRLHRLAGIALFLPLLAWAATGAVFHLKPGYGAAYAPLAVKTYPLETAGGPAGAGWLETRRVRTVLGDHLLVRETGGTRHLDPATLADRPAPAEADVRRLLEDAFSADPARYGRVVSVDGLRAETDTGARVTLDWTDLSLSQRGRDTDFIDRLYKIHYLQWTGRPALDNLLGAAGLLLLCALSLAGAALFFRGTRP